MTELDNNKGLSTGQTIHTKPIRIVFTVALKQELPDIFHQYKISILHLKAALSGDLRSLDSDSSVICLITGVGKENSCRASEWIINELGSRYDINCVVNFGSAGALDTSLSIGDLVIPHHFSANSQSLTEGIGCFPFFNHNLTLKTSLACHSVETITTGTNSELGLTATIVDQEAYWQADYFSEYTIPFTSVKCITDHNDSSSLQNFNEALALLRKQFDALFHTIFQPAITGVSVVIPTYNREHTLRRAIESVLTQTISNLECIVVNDGSTDSTSDFLSSYGDRITVINRSENKGVSVARNDGIRAASYDWVSFLDSDDEWSAEKLETQISFLNQHPFYSIVQSNEQWIRNGSLFSQKKHHQKQSGFIFEGCLERCMIGPSCVMIRKAVFDTFGLFDESLPACEDYDLWLRMSRYLLVGLDPSVSTIKYGGHSDQLSTTVATLDKYRIQALEKCLSEEASAFYIERITLVLDKKKAIYEGGLAKRQQLS